MDSKPLNQDELQALQHHLEIIKISFVMMVKSLAQIHSLRLYRGEGNRTWQKFCAEELNFSERYGHYFIQAFAVLDAIEAHNATAIDPLPLPSRVAQTRALSTVPEELVINVWQATTAKYGNSPTAKNIYSVSNDMTISELLIIKGVSDVDVLSALSTLADKSEHGRTLVTELLVTGYLQSSGDDEDAIPLQDIRIADLRHYEDNQRREAIARRIADSGGVTVVIYPNDPIKTAGVLRGVMTDEQAYDLWFNLGESTKTPTF